jgi:hypothetical protein
VRSRVLLLPLRARESAVPGHLQGPVDSLPARAEEEPQEEAVLAISQLQWGCGLHKEHTKKTGKKGILYNPTKTTSFSVFLIFFFNLTMAFS